VTFGKSKCVTVFEGEPVGKTRYITGRHND